MINRIKNEFKQYFEIDDERHIRANAYGLTGAGILFLNSTLKVMIRMNKASEKIERVSSDLWERMAQSPTKDTPFLPEGGSMQSWFVVKHLDDQCIYMQLTQNDFSEEYNGAVFKVKL